VEGDKVGFRLRPVRKMKVVVAKHAIVDSSPAAAVIFWSAPVKESVLW